MRTRERKHYLVPAKSVSVFERSEKSEGCDNPKPRSGERITPTAQAVGEFFSVAASRLEMFPQLKAAMHRAFRFLQRRRVETTALRGASWVQGQDWASC